MAYLHDDFFLQGEMARRLYHEVAAQAPIYDYHCHLSQHEIAVDQRWDNMATLWLGGDHYKWRLMRANGIAEERITGAASPRDKFQAWAETVPMTLRNPIHHWTHLELRRYFGIDALLTPATAESIWQECNAQLAREDFSARGLLRRFRVKMVGTTDDPAAPLDDHLAIAASGFETRVLPTYRPDKVFGVDQPQTWNTWVDRLGVCCDREIGSYAELCAALHQRHDDFHEAGARMSDHGLDRCPALACSDAQAEAIFQQARRGEAVTGEEQERFIFALMVFFGQLDAEKGWTKQLHLGPFRNVNSRMARELGADSGFDTIGDSPQGRGLVTYLDALASSDQLPNVILYNINPRDNYLFAAMTGAFQDGKTPGKIQFGSGWWFLDQKDGIELQLNALSSTGLLSRFIGMLTDSRSFLSFPRHEYFRRILCNIIGQEAERGELPDDFEVLAELIAAVCSENARRILDA